MATDSKLIEILNTTRRLPMEDKIQLIRSMTDQIENDLKLVQNAKASSLRGLWKKTSITEEDIDKNRQDMWQDFPREISE